MNCPNCGTYYDENEKICKKCHTPLSNAVYNLFFFVFVFFFFFFFCLVMT